MRIVVILVLGIVALNQNSFGQTSSPSTPPTGWERIYIKNVGSFDLPPSMEVQRGTYKELIIENRKKMGLDAAQITAQPKGVNEFGEDGLKKYARIILNTTIELPGSFEKLNFRISDYSTSEIAEINNHYRQQIQNSFSGTELKLVKWFPLEFEKINGMSCIHISYKRQYKNNSIVLVHIYSFHNDDRIHNLTLSYRLSEANYWKSDLKKVLDSFRITNIR